MSGKYTYSTTNYTAQEYKDIGNKSFNQRKYNEAISYYSKAINKNPSCPLYYTNRALCNLKLGNWNEVTEDSKKALDIDNNLVKGHFFLGVAMYESGSFEEAIIHLQKAFDLAKDQNLNFGDQIASQLRAARRKRFQFHEERRVNQEILLQSHLNELIDKEKKEKLEAALHDSSLSDEERDTKLRDAVRTAERARTELNALFAKADEQRRTRSVPDYLCGKISFELLRDPVITPSGITYERRDIEEHLQRVGHFDPMTRVHLTQDMLVPNYAMKEVVDMFVQENPWALDY